MKIKQLKNLLEEEGIDPEVYSLCGRKADDQYVLDHKWCRWMCYYFERGHRYNVKHFKREEEACHYMPRWMNAILYIRGYDNENHSVAALNREKLKNMFDQMNRDPDEYSLYGPTENAEGNKLILDEQDGEWLVYSIKSGEKMRPCYFESEWEACLHMIDSMIESMDDTNVDKITFLWSDEDRDRYFRSIEDGKRKNFISDLVNIQSTIIENHLHALNAIYTNGGTILRCFKISRFSEFMNLLRQSETSHFFQALLASKSVRNAIPEFTMDVIPIDELNLEMIPKDSVKKHFMQMINFGGAYTNFDQHKKIADELNELVDGFLGEVTEQRHDDFEIYYYCGPWNDWFWDVAWDNTYMFLDKKKELIWIFCTTDTD